MCGISGLVSWSGIDAPRLLERMTSALAHRGPDDSGLISGDSVHLGHRRLSVIDTSAAGHQPMTNEDGSIWITYNGELYGAAPLRRRLEDRGHVFRSRTDTEVLIHLYEEEGAGLLPLVNGMFAFAVHDRARRRLLLARDRLGIKPLFYAFTADGLVFGSEIKAVLAGLGGTPSLRADVLGQYILQGFASAPDTVFEGVWSLPPGHSLDVDLHGLRLGERPEPVEYWDAAFTGDDTRPLEEIGRELESLLADAVAIQMVADVPLGAFLSGGIDSSTVVALMARSSPAPIRTFTVDLPGCDRSERSKAQAVADHCHTRHHVIDATMAGADAYWERLEHFDAPFNCASLLSAWLVSRATREHVTVALSGDGGDELFGGYDRYAALARGGAGRARGRFWHGAGAFWPHDWRGGGRLAVRARDDFLRTLTARHPLPVRTAERLVGSSLRPWIERMRLVYERHPADRLTRAMYLDLKTYLPDHVLAKVDSASMAVSLEVRVPLLDHRLVELAGRIPSSLKVRDGTLKWILKRLARPLLPSGLTEQPKVGFDPPLSSWVFDAHRERVLDELSAPGARLRGWLDGRLIDRWVDTLRRGYPWRIPQRSTLWAVYQFERWLQRPGG